MSSARPVRLPRGTARAGGLVLGFTVDRWLADPARWHPVAGFGRLAGALERRWWAPRRGRGTAYAAVLVGSTTLAGAAVAQAPRDRPVATAGATAVATWAVLGGA
ncbi:MAG: cobalamin biosynthesis protein CobD, partial [Marmoricola sp.]|nr:cobalamin biosynthesis protein CobD [Marmoricola sp.]